LVMTICASNRQLIPFLAVPLPENPIANIGRTIHEFDALRFTHPQETDDIQVNKCYFFKIKHDPLRFALHCFPDVLDIGRANSSAQPQSCSLTIGSSSDSQGHRLIGAFDIPKGKRLNVNGFLVLKNILMLRNSDFRRHLADTK
jgi:hypothetical protein